MLTKKHPDGKTIDIQGQEIHLPPEGVVWDYFNGGGWTEAGVVDWGTDVEDDQFWRRTGIPDWYKEARRKEVSRQRQDTDYFDEICEAYREDQWAKRMNGIWFMNGPYGPEYITGLHWWYMEWWFIAASVNDGYPIYLIPDKEIFYLIRFACDDPKTLGTDILTKRQSGKSAKAAAFLCELITRIPSSRGGIQSKTDEDAEKVMYKKSLFRGFERLPHFFVPEWNKPSRRNVIPSTLVFRNNKKTLDDEFDATEIGLDSVIDYRPRTVLAYDGETLHGYIGDEIRKTHIDVEERRSVVRKSCTDPLTGDFRGKIVETTTVETTEGNIEEMEMYQRMWEDSDQQKRDPETGMTPSGMIHYLLHSDRARNFDKFGHTDRERNRKVIIAQRPDPSKSLKKYYSEVRKEPLNIEEAFRIVANECMFNALKLNDRLEFLTWRDDIKIRRGKLKWVGAPAGLDIKTREFNRGGKVEFVDDPGGRFYVYHMPPEELLNNIKWRGNTPVSQNDKLMASGVDPIDHDVVDSAGNKSNACCAVKYRRNFIDNELSETFFLFYVGRPAKSSTFYEEMIMLHCWLGISNLYEDNRDKMKGYFEFRGFVNLLWTMPGKKKPGISASPRSKQDLAEATDDYIDQFSEKIFFKEYIIELLKFDIKKTRKYDRVMAAGWALVKDLWTLYRSKYENRASTGGKKYVRKRKQIN